ncbi:hypothetical protein ACA910_011271 [Epithemia clementina (nom. ined.)]
MGSDDFKRTASNASAGPQMFNYEKDKARVFLAIACLWPFLLMALFASSSPHVVPGETKNVNGEDGSPIINQHYEAKEGESSVRLNLRNVLDRVDIMGYGPTHPRIGVVVTGDKASVKSHYVSTVESIFSYTDLSRIFVVAVVVDGHEHDMEWEKDLKKIHDGLIPHLHGLRLDIHDESKQGNQEEEQHESKVHVMFNAEPQGITACRQDGADFVHILAKHHESAGLKSTSEDIILVLIHAGTVLTSRKWLPAVTQALIVPPPLLSSSSVKHSDVPLKLANAVSFNLEGAGKRTTFDPLLTPQIESPTTDELNQSSGASYMAPAWNGAAMALRLETYRQLPMHDESMTESWPANLDLSLALWLCADGMDMVAASAEDDALTVQLVPGVNPATAVTAPLSPAMGARFAEAWMDEMLQRKFFHLYTHTYKELTYLEWQTFQAQARQSPSFVGDLAQKCRSLEWYMHNVNPSLLPILEQSAVVDRPKPPKENTVSEGAAKVLKQLNQMRLSETTSLHKEPQQHSENEHKEPQQHSENEHKEPQQHSEKEHKEPQQHLEKEQHSDEKGGLPVVRNEQEQKSPMEEDGNSVAIPARRDLKKPSKPLCQECLSIVEKAKPVNLEKIDVSGGHKEHPHMGAKDVDGNYGYIHNETHLHLDPPSFNMNKDDLKTACTRRDNNYRMLTEKVYVDMDYDTKAQAELGDNRVKIFCLVYTTEKGHSNIPRIRETWGQKCDGFMVGSTKTDPSIDAVEIPHEGPEEYDNIWQKVRSMWSYIYDNYYDKYDWFHIGGDDLYVIVENLKQYLESEEIRTAANGGTYLPDGSETSQTPLFLGRRFAYMGNMDDIFISGGSGYTINKAALKTLVVDGIPSFRPHAKTFSEDTMVARMLKEYGIEPYETKDEEGGERYMPFMPGHHYGYRLPADKSQDWYAKYSINIKTGKDHCAAKSIAFHYVKDLAMYRLHAILYGLCPPGTLS